MFGKIILAQIILINGFGVAQHSHKLNGCITDSIRNTETAFTRFEIESRFKGNMRWFLTRNIGLDSLLCQLEPSDTFFADTARITFLMGRKGSISNVNVSKATNLIFKAEALRLFKLSSCNWQMGEQGGRYVDGWVQFELYFRINRMHGEIKMNIDYKQILPVEVIL